MAYPALREEILKEILPLQLGDKEPIDVAMQDAPKDLAREIAKKIDDFMFDYDFYEYKDQELYPGYNLEQTTCLVRKDDFEPIKSTLKEVLESDDVVMHDDAAKLLKKVEQYERDNPIQIEEPSLKRSGVSGGNNQYHLVNQNTNHTMRSS